MDKRKLHIMTRQGLDQLFELLAQANYTIIGPTVREGAMVYAQISSTKELPMGWSDYQEPGHYSLEHRGHNHYFAFVPGADSWKRFLFPPRICMFAAVRNGGPETPFKVEVLPRETGRMPPRYAFVGVRACELAAIAIQDKVITSEIQDPYYKQAREQAFIVAVNCVEPGRTCFCASMGTGPKCNRDFDLCLTELNGELSIEVGSEKGADLFRKLPVREASPSECRLHDLLLERAREHMGRTLDTDGLPELLAQNLESPHWERIAKKCLACGNCTMVCPTCFCYNVHDHTDLSGKRAERWRLWGSCFTLEFSYLGSHTIRTEGFSRYRQWMTHKLMSWHEQFGSSGCVGCGRCITWCPVGIDITEEAAAFRQPPPVYPTNTSHKKSRL